MNPANIPLALYIHFPWCIKKCPYCDFNSHTLKDALPEQEYVQHLLRDLDQRLEGQAQRSIISIFMGGGTPSLFSAGAMETLLTGIRERCQLVDNIEITLEANPSSVEQQRFKAYRDIGINRLSIGVQSFSDRHLKALGRVHDSQEAFRAINTVHQAGFSNFNIDIMFGLPDQSLAEGLTDLKTGLSLGSTHLSWYELTIEPNTAFWHQPPPMPTHELSDEMQVQGQALLQAADFEQYEISAYSRQQPCRHNLNYWEFGDYLAIGAGSHGKITRDDQSIVRYQHVRHPKQYLSTQNTIQEEQIIESAQLPFEFFLNTLRLRHGIPAQVFSERTGLALGSITKQLDLLQNKGWLTTSSDRICTTELGYRFLNDVVAQFLPQGT